MKLTATVFTQPQRDLPSFAVKVPHWFLAGANPPRDRGTRGVRNMLMPGAAKKLTQLGTKRHADRDAQRRARREQAKVDRARDAA